MTIETDTPIIPLMVAETVVGAWQTWLMAVYPAVAIEVEPKADEIAEYLAARAEQLYQSNKGFKFQILLNGNRGRDRLYAFMHHWMYGNMLKSFPAIDRELIPHRLIGWRLY